MSTSGGDEALANEPANKQGEGGPSEEDPRVPSVEGRDIDTADEGSGASPGQGDETDDAV